MNSLVWRKSQSEIPTVRAEPRREAVERSRDVSGTDNDDSQLTAFDARVEYLAILAQTLLQEIEKLKESSKTLRCADVNLSGEVRRIERELLRNTLIRTGGRQRRAARLLGMKVTTLNTKIKRYRIKLDMLRSESGT